MKVSDLTTDQISQSVRRSLITEYGDAWWTYPVAVKANATPMVVVYERASAMYRRTFTIDFVGDFPNAILGGEESEVVQQTVYIDVPVVFSAPEGDESSVEWSGLLFRGGDFGKKGRYGPTELESFVSTFPAQGVPIKDSHRDTFFGMCLNDHGAKVSRVWLSDDKNELHGAFQAPSWAADAAKNRTKGVSIGLTEDLTGLSEVSLVLNPHVEDAAVFERDLARAVAAAPTFSAFAAAHPDDARLVTEAAKPPVHPLPMLTQEQKIEEAKKAYAALPQFMREGQTEAEFVTFATAQAAKPAPTKEDPAIRADVDQMRAEMAAQKAEFAADQDANDALTFYRENMEFYGPGDDGEATAKAEFSLARRDDRRESKSVTFSRNAENSEEKRLWERVVKRPKVFARGTSLESNDRLSLETREIGLGMFSKDDFHPYEESK